MTNPEATAPSAAVECELPTERGWYEITMTAKNSRHARWWDGQFWRYCPGDSVRIEYPEAKAIRGPLEVRKAVPASEVDEDKKLAALYRELSANLPANLDTPEDLLTELADLLAKLEATKNTRDVYRSIIEAATLECVDEVSADSMRDRIISVQQRAEVAEADAAYVDRMREAILSVLCHPSVTIMHEEQVAALQAVRDRVPKGQYRIYRIDKDAATEVQREMIERAEAAEQANAALSERVERLVSELADGMKWNWTVTASYRDAADRALQLMVELGLVEGCQHPNTWGGTGYSVYRANGNLYGRTDGIDVAKFNAALAAAKEGT
jgi:hypothetical protein